VATKSHLFLDRLAGRLSGEMDLASAPDAEVDLLAAAISRPGTTVDIDCAGLTFIDSSGVHMLQHVAKRSGKSVQLVNVDRSCRRVFEILGFCGALGAPRINP
jgi:anti-anti-sigma factor